MLDRYFLNYQRQFINIWKKRIILLLLSLLFLVACAQSQLQEKDLTPKSRLELVLKRGKLICGVNGELPGFSFIDQNGKYSGIDVDFCRAIAAAMFNNPNAIEYRTLPAVHRFTALKTGEIDILLSNTTWTISRDTSIGLEFAPIIFYDGQGMMVHKGSGIKSLKDMQDSTICVITGTTTELNLADQMRIRKVSYQPLTFEEVNVAFSAYQAGRCTGITTDRSGLVARRMLLPRSNDHLILEDVMSKEPLSPAVLNGDSRWFDVVKWIVHSTMQAEELGITSNNLIEQQKSENIEIKRFLGIEGELGKNIGLSNDFTARVIRHVGNYGEIYDHNLGKDSKLNLPRGLNRLWNRGGLIYSPPFR